MKTDGKSTFCYNFVFSFVPGEKFSQPSRNNCIVFISSKYNLMVGNTAFYAGLKTRLSECIAAEEERYPQNTCYLVCFAATHSSALEYKLRDASSIKIEYFDGATTALFLYPKLC
jgi:hypothetical protein